MVMKSTIVAAMAIAGPLVMSACTSWPLGAAPERPECRPEKHLIYYNFHEDDLRVTAQPVIQRIAEQVAACRKAGGELESVTIVGFPNRTENSDSGDATAVARGQAVLGALVAAGVPIEKISLASYRLEPDDINQPMRRRAEIAVEMR
jgi:outer membrane protein OmpA-like peptidoglycan-associated protein